ncbi:hypothetical protein [Glutamicibacter sp. AOP3-A1-12]|uniref:hypothetical protein n=1 Tax=Glutamicibacter sp. AOP3-A1-12 TaxID=3457701 RepID=UPI004034F086
MYEVRVAKEWQSSKESKLILRLKNSHSGESNSYAIQADKSRKVTSAELPGANKNAVVAWVDENIDGMNYPLTERVRVNSLHRIIDLIPYFSQSVEHADDDVEFNKLLNLVDAWRWITPENVNSRLAPLTTNILPDIRSFKTDDKSFLSQIRSKLSSRHPINDGSTIMNSILYVYYISKIHESLSSNKIDLSVNSYPAKNDLLGLGLVLNEMLECDSFVAIRGLQEIAGHVIRNTRPANSTGTNFMAGVDDLPLIPELLRGIFTFGTPEDRNIGNIDLKLITSHDILSKTDGPVVLYSADPKYLRAYLTRVLFYMTTLPELKYHFHVVADEFEARDISDLISKHLQEICSVRKIDYNAIYFEVSYSSLPINVPEPKSYFASARYLVASKVMARHDTSVWIQDIDLYPTGDITKFIARLESNDISLYKSRVLGGMLPWVRHLAGNVYVKNTPTGFKFLSFVEEYLQEFLIRENSWMIDQNSLSYGIEKIGIEVGVGDTRTMRIPVQQSNLAARIEGS